MSIITSFVNVIAGASVLLGGESFMNKKIGGSDVPLRNAIGVPLLGVGTLGILVSYIRNRRVREDKKAESDFYEAELYEADGWTEKIGAGRKAYCGTCERLIQQSTRIYVNDSNGDIECADCYEYQQEAETFDAEEPKYVRGITVGQRPKMKRGWSIITHGTGHHEQRYATKDGITVLIQKIPANSYWGRQKNARYRLTYNRDVPDADSLVPQAKFFSTYEAIFDWLDNPPFEIQSFDAEEYGAETFGAESSPIIWDSKKGQLIDPPMFTVWIDNDTEHFETFEEALEFAKNEGEEAQITISYYATLKDAETFEAMSTDKTFTGETASGHKVQWDDGSFTMTFAEPIDGYTDVSGYWYGGDDRTPTSFTLDVQNDDYESIDLYIDGVEAYGVSTNHMGVYEDELSLQVREAVKEGLDWMLGDYEEKTVVERQYRAEEDEKRINGMTLDEWLDEIDRIKATKEPFYYSNNILGSPKYGNMIDMFWEQGWTPQGILDAWESYDRQEGHWDKIRAETFDAEPTPYGESDNEYPVRIIVGGPPHSGKSTLMNLLEDKMNQYGIPVELRDLDFSSPTNLKAGFDPNRKTKDWTEELARDAANYFREDSQDQIVLGDSIGLISRINEIVSEPADVAILLVSGSKDQYDESFRNALEKWKSYYDFIDLPILMVIRSSMNPNEMNYFDPHDNYGVIVGLDRDAYKDGGIDNEISLENACLEGMVFEIAQEYDLELANRNTDEHIATISEKWPNIEGKPTWNPIDAGKPHLGKIEDDYFSTFDERRKVKAMSAESFGAEKSVCRCGKGISNPKCKSCDSPICSDCDWQYANKCIECFGSRFNAENDPDFDREKADRNKDGEISDWEQSVGNAVAKGIREHGQKKDKSSSIGDMEHYMNMRWNEYTPKDKREMWLMDLNYGHSNKNTKRYFKKGYEYGWKLARIKAANGEPLYMVARAKDLITTSPRKNGFFMDSGAYMGFEDSWLTYEGKEPVNHMAKVMNAEPLETHMAEEEADFYTVLYRETEDDHLEVDDDYDNLNEAMSAYQHFINQGMEQVIIAGYDRTDEGGYEEQSVAIAEYLVDGYDRRPQSYQ